MPVRKVSPAATKLSNANLTNVNPGKFLGITLKEGVLIWPELKFQKLIAVKAALRTNLLICYWFFIQYNELAKIVLVSKIGYLPAHSFIR